MHAFLLLFNLGYLWFLTADVCSVYIKNLPLNATPAQLEEEFKRFGPIKSGGVQVRSNKVLFSVLFSFSFVSLLLNIRQQNSLFFCIWMQQQGFCFGFVEFEVASAVQQAIEVKVFTYLETLLGVEFFSKLLFCNIFCYVISFSHLFHLPLFFLSVCMSNSFCCEVETTPLS